MNILILTLGQSRGYNFKERNELDLLDVVNALYASDSREEFIDIMDEMKAGEFEYLDYNNVLTDEGYKDEVMKWVKKVANGKFVIVGWEEGTTGMGLAEKEKELKQDIYIDEMDARSGMEGVNW